jgi:hypothetical protein
MTGRESDKFAREHSCGNDIIGGNDFFFVLLRSPTYAGFVLSRDSSRDAFRRAASIELS